MTHRLRTLLVITLLGACMPLHAAGFKLVDFNDCSPEALEEVRRRIFAPGPGGDRERPLAPIVFARDVVHLHACGNGTATSPGAIVERRLVERHVTEKRIVSIDEDSPLFPAARDACISGEDCEFYRSRDFEPPVSFGLAKSGGLPFAMFLGHVGKGGHYEVTGRALEAMRRPGFAWSQHAAELLQDASRDADFYEWNNPAAHAQTRNSDADGRISESQADARKGFESWARAYLGHAEAQCASGNTRTALYLLGYALHGVQDLVFHEGITNAEHSFRDFVEDLQIDARHRYDEKMALAERATVTLLEKARERFDRRQPGCWQRLADWAGEGALSDKEKRAALGIRQKDFSVAAYFAYEKLSRLLKSRLLSGGRESDYFIAPHWLETGKEHLLVQFIGRIFQ